jgi:hypothetical protein
MIINLVSEDDFKIVWEFTEQHDRSLCDLTCRHIFNYTQNTLWIVASDCTLNPTSHLSKGMRDHYKTIVETREQLNYEH